MTQPDATQVTGADLPTEMTNSPLYNPDLAPTPMAHRTWTTYNFAALWIAMAHCLPTYMLAGGLITLGMNWWQALLTIFLGNIIVLVPILLNAHPGTKYGIPFPVLARSSFGTTGANIPAILRAIVACGWFGIQCFIGGEAVRVFLETLWPAFANIGGGEKIFDLAIPSLITLLIFWAMNLVVVLKGVQAVRVFENWSAPIIMLLALWLLVWVVARAGGLGPMLDRPSSFATHAEFWRVFVPSLTGMVGFWATLSLNIPDFTRYGRGQKQQMLGQAIGLPTTMVLFSAMAIVITSASETVLKGTDPTTLWDPIVVLGHLTSSTAPPGLDAPLIQDPFMRVAIALLSLVGVAVATISTNIAANVVGPANDFSQLAPRLISFKTGSLITAVIGLLIMPWKLLASADVYIFNWLIGYSALLGPIAGIMIVDYWILRRRTLHVMDLYQPHGRYAGVNKIALIALALGVAPNVLGFLKSVKMRHGPPDLFDAIYPYAWFTGVLVAGGIYWLFSPTRYDRMRS